MSHRAVAPRTFAALSLMAAALSLSAIALVACEPIVAVRGHAPTPGSLEKLQVGEQTREQVVRLLGSPSTASTFADSTWYYIMQKQEEIAFLPNKTIDQRVTAVAFGADGRIASIKTYKMEDGKVIDMATRTTPTAGKELTVMEQVLGNVGRFGDPKGKSGPVGGRSPI
jgi:outer membrane protein assembly factor BamE (lipoprotein component of BamABCDE complex)